jgi:hypothetical protein
MLRTRDERSNSTRELALSVVTHCSKSTTSAVNRLSINGTSAITNSRLLQNKPSGERQRRQKHNSHVHSTA